MRVVSSRQHPLVRGYRDLALTADPDGARLLLDGVHLVREALAASLTFESVAVASSRAAESAEVAVLVRTLEAAGTDVVSADDRVLDAMSPVRSPSGIVAIARRKPVNVDSILNGPSLFALMIADVQDPGNVGSLIRVAEATGASGVLVCGESANPFSWKAVRGSMGSLLRMPVARCGSTRHAVRDIQKAQARLVAAVPRGGLDPATVNWSGRVVLALGGEGQGLDADIVASSDETVTVPMAASVESLNVNAAGAILLYLAARGRS